jgi:hypothetical protein
VIVAGQVVEGRTSDIIYNLLFQFIGDAFPGCLAACNADGVGGEFPDLQDVIYQIEFLFNDGLPLPPPYPECGLDPAGRPVELRAGHSL